jgi:hypothetical protein
VGTEWGRSGDGVGTESGRSGDGVGSPPFLLPALPDASPLEAGPVRQRYFFAALNSGTYLPYPSASSFAIGMNRIAAEFMQ